MIKEKNIKPLRDYVLIKIQKEEKEKTQSGIYLPKGSSEDQSQVGKVVAVGDDKKISVKKGQTVIYAKFSGTEVDIDKEEYRLVKNEDILAVL